jgi:hypothetical protein
MGKGDGLYSAYGHAEFVSDLLQSLRLVAATGVGDGCLNCLRGNRPGLGLLHSCAGCFQHHQGGGIDSTGQIVREQSMYAIWVDPAACGSDGFSEFLGNGVDASVAQYQAREV